MQNCINNILEDIQKQEDAFIRRYIIDFIKIHNITLKKDFLNKFIVNIRRCTEPNYISPSGKLCASKLFIKIRQREKYERKQYKLAELITELN